MCPQKIKDCRAFVQISNPNSSIQSFGQKADLIISDHPPPNHQKLFKADKVEVPSPNQKV